MGLDQLSSGYDYQYAQTKSDVKTSIPDAVKKAEQRDAKKKAASAKTSSKDGKKSKLAQLSETNLLQTEEQMPFFAPGQQPMMFPQQMMAMYGGMMPQMNPMMMAAMQQPQWGSYMAPPMMPMFNPYAAMMP